MNHIKKVNKHIKPLFGKILLLCVILITGSAHAELSSYIDDNGVIRFTNIPPVKEQKITTGGGWPRSPSFSFHSTAQSGQYDNIIRKAGGIYGVSCALIKAIIHAESNFNSKAVSSKGARGLMQIMPDNDETLNISDPFNPQQNIMGGTKYFKRMLNRYQNNLFLALAAYNAGPAAVDKYQEVPPYKETQTYIDKVNSLYLYYLR